MKRENKEVLIGSSNDVGHAITSHNDIRYRCAVLSGGRVVARWQYELSPQPRTATSTVILRTVHKAFPCQYIGNKAWHKCLKMFRNNHNNRVTNYMIKKKGNAESELYGKLMKFQL